MTPADKQRLIETVLKHQKGRASFAEASERLLDEMDQELVTQGVSASLLRCMRALHRERWALRRAMHDMARNSFPVEPLPDGALPVYDRDPAVASLVTDDPEAGE